MNSISSFNQICLNIFMIILGYNYLDITCFIIFTIYTFYEISYFRKNDRYDMLVFTNFLTYYGIGIFLLKLNFMIVFFGILFGSFLATFISFEKIMEICLNIWLKCTNVIKMIDYQEINSKITILYIKIRNILNYYGWYNSNQNQVQTFSDNENDSDSNSEIDINVKVEKETIM